MDRHPPPDGHETHDAVSRHRCTAAGDAHHHVVESFDDDPRTRRRILAGPDGSQQVIVVVVFGPDGSDETLHDRVHADLTFAHGRHQSRRDVLSGELRRDVAEQRLPFVGGQTQSLLAQRGHHLFATVHNRQFPPLLQEPLLDLRPRPRGADELQPIARGSGIL
jgi:hypothetical protein